MTQYPEKARVLVVDDDASIRQLVCTIIQREQIEVDCAADGLEAIEYLQQHHYAVILLDLMMPRGSGFDVVDHIRAHPAPKKPVVLVISAYADQTFKEVDPEIVAGVLRKPFEVAELGNIVRLCVHGYDSNAHQRLVSSRDSAIRELAMTRFSAPTHAGEGSEAN